MQPIKTTKGEILAVLLENEIVNLDLYRKDGLTIGLIYSVFNKDFTMPTPIIEFLPDGNWQLIAPLSEITELQAKMMVDYVAVTRSLPPVFKYECFGDWQKEFDNALDSFKSLMQANEVYEVNSFECPNINDFKSSPFCESGKCKAYEDALDEWNKAQERTGNWIILFKPKE